MSAIGRPARYTQEIAQRILDHLAAGRSLREVCCDDGMPSHSTVLQWVKDDRDGFGARYRRAREINDGPATCPTRYTPEIAERILNELSDGRTLVEICRDPGMPSVSTVRQWVAEDRDGFAARYRQVKTITGNKAGCPTIYSAEIAEQILEDLCDGRSLAALCGDPGMPSHPTVRRWVAEDRDGFAARYTTAREIGCETIADEILQIADRRDCWIELDMPDGTTEIIFDRNYVRRTKQRVSARCWLLSKMWPRKPRGRI